MLIAPRSCATPYRTAPYHTVPRKKAQTFHGKYTSVLSVIIILYVFACIYTTGNLKRQGGWVNKSSSPFQNFLKFYNATPYFYICNNFFLGPMATIGSYI